MTNLLNSKMIKAQSSKYRELSLYCICTPHGDYIQCPTEIKFNIPQISQIYTDFFLVRELHLCKSVKSVGLKNNPWD